MKPIDYARKKRQLHYLARRLNDLLLHHKEVSRSQINKLVSKIQKLVAELIRVISHADMKRILGAAAIYIGIALPYHASSQDFLAPQVNPFGLVSTYVVAAPVFADLDNDGDLDLLVGEYYGAMQYFENTGTSSNPQFAAPQVNPFGLDSAIRKAFPALADLDGDGDMDLLVGEYYDDDYFNQGMQYYENIGSVSSPQFGAPQRNPFGLTPTYEWAFPTFADLDADGDTDLLVGEYGGVLQYFENIGTATNPVFAAPVSGPFGLDYSHGYYAYPTFADLDEDGDLDLLVGTYGGGLVYYENTGSASNPQFAPWKLFPFGLSQTYIYAVPTFADLDSDGDMDLLVGEGLGSMQYFENTGTSAVEKIPAKFDLQIFPNPVSDLLSIRSEEKIKRIEIYNTLGQAVGTFENNNNLIRLENLNPGVYVAKFITPSGEFTTRKFHKQ